MKFFMKFLVTILVVTLVGYVVYYLCIVNKPENELLENKSGEEIINAEPIISGETYKSGETDEKEFSSDILLEHQKEKIKLRIAEIESGEIVKQTDVDLDLSVAGKAGENLKEYFNVEKLHSTVIVKKGKIEVIPYIDFLNNQIFYFDDNGKLIFYESISNGVGGSSRYYFENEALLDVEHNYDEPSLFIEDEKIDEILFRAKLLYLEFDEVYKRLK